ncbi:MAG TPA: cyclase family protein [bacterium]|nr:cyclase family protein [bacterium]HQG44125.1 cyclase family protein [bacterium]HQI49655.1 cyclase family protein [bacterium]HQJ64342.1 cyclase family protein [bacterium]HQJ65454.1 cyclase family protein [bacterium]
MRSVFPFRILDLSHPFAADMPVWPGDPPVWITPTAGYEREGYLLNALSCGEHSGTHCGAPCHFVTGGTSMDRFSAEQLVAPLVKITRRLHQDDLLTAAGVTGWEKRFGPIAADAAVVVETGWSSRWPDAAAYLARDAGGTMHFPGISLEAMQLLVVERGVRIVGIDTPGVDGGASADFAAGTLLAHHGGLHLENLARLAQAPPTGAWLIIGALAITGGSGAPARLLALTPRA